MQEQGKNKKVTVIIGVVIVIGVLLWTLFQYNFFAEKPVADTEMTELVAKYNKNCPLTIQEGIRLDSVSLPKEKVVQYNLTLVKVEKVTAEIQTIKENIEASLISTAKANPGLQVFRDHKYTLVYNYNDKKKVHLFEVTITPDKYK
jgi:flagellar basal body-associated protein FliL